MTQYVQNVATNVCGDLPDTIPVNIDCSLCNIGFPQAGGSIGISFFGPRCTPNTDPSPSYWLGFETKMAQWKCPNPGEDNEPAANTWVATGFFGGATRDGCTNQYRFDATLNAIDANHVSVSVVVRVLAPTTGGWSWQSYMSFSATLTEIVNADTTRYRGRNFSTPDFISVTPGSVGGVGDPVSFVKMTIGMQSMRCGCGSFGYGLPVCGFWDGTQWLTCLRGVIRSNSTYNVREFTQLGFNTAGCGGVSSGGYCLCDSFTLASTSPPSTSPSMPTYNADPQFILDYGVIGLPGGIEAVGALQQIQISAGSEAGIQLVVKQVNGGTIYICTNDNGAGWICTAAVVSQAKGPRILTATRATFDIWLYTLNFPNDNLLPTECSGGGDYPVPSPSDPYWCTVAGCVQSPLQPANSLAGPYATSMLCAAACSGIIPPADPWWCVGTTCVQSATPPEGYSSGPYDDSSACSAVCNPPTGTYWCLYGNCVVSATSPDASATGPYTTPEACAPACPGPAQMVWVCTNSGCGTTARSSAIMSGTTYYLTESACQAACPIEFYCNEIEGSVACFQYAVAHPPASYLSGPYATIDNCYDGCDTGPGWYCLGGICGNYSARPVGAYGPRHTSYFNCQSNCVVIEPIEMAGPPVELERALAAAQQAETPPDLLLAASKPFELPRADLASIQRARVPCKHLGDFKEYRKMPCSCGNFAIFNCSKHGECIKVAPRDGKSSDGVYREIKACMNNCGDYEASK